MLQSQGGSEGGSEIKFCSHKRTHFLLPCVVTVANGAALLIKVPVAAMFYLTVLPFALDGFVHWRIGSSVESNNTYFTMPEYVFDLFFQP